jgi:ferredoxin-NADP reductase
VTATRRESHDTVTLELEPPAGRTFSFQPGQFNMLYAFGVGEVPISVSGDPEAPGPVRHTIRDMGAVTHALCARQPGQDVGVRGPYGTHWPVAEAEGGDVVVVAGGVGMPPMRSAFYHLITHRDRYRRIVLLYGARTCARSSKTGWTCRTTASPGNASRPCAATTRASRARPTFSTCGSSARDPGRPEPVRGAGARDRHRQRVPW